MQDEGYGVEYAESMWYEAESVRSKIAGGQKFEGDTVGREVDTKERHLFLLIGIAELSNVRVEKRKVVLSASWMYE